MTALLDRWRQIIGWWMLVAECVAWLLLARLALHIIPFQRLVTWIARPLRGVEIQGLARQQQVRRVRKALFFVWGALPVKTTCLHRALAGQALLRRRRISTTLYYGARTLPHEGLQAHAWLMDGDNGVIGHRIAARDGYHLLACYPPAPGDLNYGQPPVHFSRL